MIRVVIADDHHLVRQGIRALLERVEEIEVIGEADDGAAALALVEALAPDVLVTDISMTGMNGLDAVRVIADRHPGTEVVILTMYSSDVMVKQAFKNGARGYLLKDAMSDELITAVRAASRGATYLSPAISDALLGGITSGETEVAGRGLRETLTPREREILVLICDGETNQAIAHHFGISVKTVERHRANLMGKLGVQNLVGLVRTAIQQGLVRLDD